MRVLFTVSDYPAHYFPMVPMAWALQSAGHDVRVACTPEEAGPVGRAGLVPVPVLDGPDMLVRGRIFHYFAALGEGADRSLGMPLHPVTGQVLEKLSDFDWPGYKRENQQRNLAAIRRSLDDTVEFARQWRPDLVLHDLMSLEGVLAAQVLGRPALCHLWGPLGPAETEPGATLVPQDHTESFARHGVGPMAPELIGRVIDPCPTSIAAPFTGERLPVRYVPYNGPGAVAAADLGRRSGRPRICVIWGNSLAGLLGPRSFLPPRIAAALGGLDAEVLLACDPATLTDEDRAALPGNVRVLGYAPLGLLLPTCDAVVHHGGAGGGMTAAAIGVPQLALPFTVEQSVNARRMAQSGAALALDGRTADEAAIRAAVESLLDGPGHRAAAAALSAEIADRPSPARLVRELLAAAAG
ncbi:nucleotide disphospho-sugar-binding domain-containing protein [Kitasatospora sp. NPDC101235]|uniref:nucleotide disphospho-sugar-binding domain-containing protein n=1 Tax=Kitasatospora sp. NPDC101235 TaxID=3364101 RepID=UPI00382834D0